MHTKLARKLTAMKTVNNEKKKRNKEIKTNNKCQKQNKGRMGIINMQFSWSLYKNIDMKYTSTCIQLGRLDQHEIWCKYKNIVNIFIYALPNVGWKTGSKIGPKLYKI